MLITHIASVSDVRQQRIYVRKIGHRRDIYRDY